MAAQKGKLFLVKIGDGGGPETFTTVGGMRSTGMTINNEEVDITTKDSSGWRELLEGAGITSMSLSLSGVFTDSVSEGLVRTAANNNTIDNYQIVAEDGSTWEGAFQVTSYERSGEYNGEETYSISLASSGVIAYTDV